MNRPFQQADLSTLVAMQDGYLLLQAIEHPERGISKGDANRPTAWGRMLDLTTSVANRRRKELVDRGLLERMASGRQTFFRLTPAGMDYLRDHLLFPEIKTIRLSGTVLNEVFGQFRRERPAVAKTPSDLSNATLEVARELLRESFGHTRLVPIHELRRRMSETYGAEAARHDRLDTALQALQQQGDVRLIALTDLSRATADQLNQSIPGWNETFFYLELPDVETA